MSRPFVIAVSGAGSRVGKTTLIETLLRSMSGAAAVKVRVRDGELAVSREDDVSGSPGKDTSRYLAAGASAAFLVDGPFELARGEVERIVSDGGFGTVLVESNRMSLAMESDLSFFVDGRGDKKEGTDVLREKADVVISRVALPRGDRQ